MTKAAKRASNVPADPWEAFAYFVSRCAEGFGRELIEAGRTPTQARNAVVGCFLHMAAGEACRIAHDEGRKPDPKKWRKATAEAFSRARTRVNGRKSGAAEESQQ